MLMKSDEYIIFNVPLVCPLINLSHTNLSDFPIVHLLTVSRNFLKIFSRVLKEFKKYYL